MGCVIQLVGLVNNQLLRRDMWMFSLMRYIGFFCGVLWVTMNRPSSHIGNSVSLSEKMKPGTVDAIVATACALH
jgi:hypothetical protein